MKKTVAVVLTALLLLGVGIAEFALRGGAKVRGAVVTAEETAQYSKRDISAAVRKVKAKFSKDFPGKLLTVAYREDDDSLRQAAAWAAQFGEDEAIVLRSDFRTAKKNTGSLEPDALYTDWQWVLTRSGRGGWTLRTWGYG